MNKEMNITDLSINAVLSKQTTISCVNRLLFLGLVKEKRTTTLPSKRLISLTAKGNSAAELIKTILSTQE
jgi:predicted transcriptional regulator